MISAGGLQPSLCRPVTLATPNSQTQQPGASGASPCQGQTGEMHVQSKARSGTMCKLLGDAPTQGYFLWADMTIVTRYDQPLLSQTVSASEASRRAHLQSCCIRPCDELLQLFQWGHPDAAGVRLISVGLVHEGCPGAQRPICKGLEPIPPEAAGGIARSMLLDKSLQAPPASHHNNCRAQQHRLHCLL